MNMNSVSEDTEQITRAQVTRLAMEAFASHVITPVDGQSMAWRCGRPERSTYAFYVSIVPRAIVVTGDIRVTTFEANYHAEEALRWVMGSVDSWDYLLGKMHHRIAHRTFYPDTALALVKEYWPDNEDLIDDVTQRHQWHDLHPYAWCEIVQQYSLDDAYSIGEGWNADAFWAVEALRCFTRLHKALVGA